MSEHAEAFGNALGKALADGIEKDLAARDHLRVRLQQLIVAWHELSVRLDYQRRFADVEPQLFPETIYRLCEGDLLAVLTEQVEEQKGNEEKTLTRVVTMGEGTDSRTASDASAGSVEPPTPDQERNQP